MLLFLSIAFLFFAPLLSALSSKRDYYFSSLNGFVFVVIAALVGLDIIPELIASTGPEILVVLLLGVFLPTITEKLMHNSTTVHKIAAVIAVFGLTIHTLADGVALAFEHSEHNLALSVALHRIPIGLLVWWFIKPHFGSLVAYGMLGIIALGTLFGFGFSEQLIDPIKTSQVSYFQAFVAGTLIHVLFHRPHEEHSCNTKERKNRMAEGFGNLVGFMCVFYLLSDDHSHTSDITWLKEMGDTVVYLSLETAPMLLLAFLFAGVIKAFMPDSFVSWLKKGGTLPQASKGMAVGVPLPLCSCSVVPVYHSLIKKGVPKSAAIAFLIATPEIGIDAILISLPLLGSELTVARLVCAALLAVIVALIVSHFSPKQDLSAPIEVDETAKTQTFKEKLKSGLHYSTHDLLDHIAPWIIVGILIAALIHPILGNLSLASIPSGLQVVMFAALGIPVYVCASSATPLVAIFLINGVSPGAGLAFLLSGPATNITTFGVLAKLHNRRTALILAASCLGTSIALGLTVNAMFPNFQPLNLTGDVHDFGWIHWLSLILLLGLFGYSIFRKGMRSFIMELMPHQHDHDNGQCSHHHHHHHH